MNCSEEAIGPRGPSSSPPQGAAAPPPAAAYTELKLNITDSQLVLVEDASVWDTNAVILKVLSLISDNLPSSTRNS